MTTHVETVREEDLVGPVRRWMASGVPAASHGGWPVVDPLGRLAGIVTRKDLSRPEIKDDARVATVTRRPAKVAHPDEPLRAALDRMVAHDVGRLPVVAADGVTLLGILTRSDVLRAFRARASEDVTSAGRLPRRWRLRTRKLF